MKEVWLTHAEAIPAQESVVDFIRVSYHGGQVDLTYRDLCLLLVYCQLKVKSDLIIKVNPKNPILMDELNIYNN